MVTVDEVHSEVVVEGEDGTSADVMSRHEVRLEDLRAVVRDLVAEELDRHLRTEARSS